MSNVTRDHIVKIGKTLVSNDEIKSVRMQIRFKDGAEVTFNSDMIRDEWDRSILSMERLHREESMQRL